MAYFGYCVQERPGEICTNAHCVGAAGEHTFHGELRPFTDTVAVFIEKLIPAVIEDEEQFCVARNIQSAEYKTRQGKDKRLWLQGSRAHAGGVLPFINALYNIWLDVISHTRNRR